MSIFGQKKIPKSQQEDKTPYTLYNPHTPNLHNLNNSKWGEIIRVISIDPGTVNLCIRVEERPFNRNIKYIPKTYFYEKIHMKKEELELTEGNENKYYSRFLEIFNANWNLFKTCHIVIMERQLPWNYKAVRISQHILTYFMIHLKDLPQYPLIFEINSTLKSKQLGAKHLNSHAIKSWSVDFARDILVSRNDQFALNILNKKGAKKDDLADTVTQIEAFFSYMKWPTNSEILLCQPTVNIIRPSINIQSSLNQSQNISNANTLLETLPITQPIQSSHTISLNIIRNEISK